MRRSVAPSIKRQFPGQDEDVQVRQVVKEEQEEGNRRFQVMYGRISTKTTQKTFESDGCLELSGNRLILRDDEGFEECSTVYLKSMRLRDDSVIIIEPKEVKILREISKESEKRPQKSKPDVVFEFQGPRIEDSPPSPKKIKEEQESLIDKVEQNDDREDLRIPIHGENLQTSTQIEEHVQRRDPPTQGPSVNDAENEFILFCRATYSQRQRFQEIYTELEKLPEDEDPMEILDDLQGACNGLISPDSTEDSGKLMVLRDIVNSSLSRCESSLILCDNEDLVGKLFDYCTLEFNSPSWLLKNDGDVQELSNSRQSKIIICGTELVESIDRNRLLIHQSIIFENLNVDEETGDCIRRITSGSIFNLLVCGGLDERVYQMKHGIIPDDSEGLLLFRKPGDYDNCDSYKLLKSSRMNSSLAKDWDHIPGTDGNLRELHISCESPSSNIVFIFKRRRH